MSKGNMLIAQSGGPSMVINQSLVGAVLTATKSPKIDQIYGALHGVQGILDETFIDLRQETEETLLAVAQTPSSALGSVRKKPTPAECEKIFEVLQHREIRYFFYIGGNDTAETTYIISEAAKKAKYDLQCFHIPKTIDNDLMENDHTPGFGSAARFVACAVRGDDLDNRALLGVKIDVIMGRHAGFLTAASAAARQEPDDGPHLIYLPEVPFSLARFTSDVRYVLSKHNRCVVTVAEGICDESGASISAKFSQEVDSHGNPQLSGTGALGDFLAAHLRKLNVKRVRADTFGYLQRSFVGVVSETDAAEAYEVGVTAVKTALKGDVASGSIAIKRQAGTKYGVTYVTVPLKRVAKVTRTMPTKFINQKGNHVTQAFLDYLAPLVGPLPKTARLEQLKVKK